MKTIEETILLEEEPYNGFINLYQAMSVKQDFTSWDDAGCYQAKELELEVV